MRASYTQLKDGTWGVKVILDGNEQVAEGCQVQVATKDGSVRQETVQKILWRGQTENAPAVLARVRSNGNGGSVAKAAQSAAAPVAGPAPEPAYVQQSVKAAAVAASICPRCGKHIAVVLTGL